MTLYRFVDHFELQFATPSQLPSLDITLEIDDTNLPAFLFGGLDDALFVVTDDENGMGISEKTLNAMAKGKMLEIKGAERRRREGKRCVWVERVWGGREEDWKRVPLSCE